MAIDGFPFQHTIVVGVDGAAGGAGVTVPGIKSGDKLIGVAKYKVDGTTFTGLDTTSYAVTDDTITAAGATDGFKVLVIYGRGN